MSVAYEQFRFAPKSEFVKALKEETIQEIMSDGNGSIISDFPVASAK